jgi:hypothetical protein
MPPTVAARWNTTVGRAASNTARIDARSRRSVFALRGNDDRRAAGAAQQSTTWLPRKPAPPVTTIRWEAPIRARDLAAIIAQALLRWGRFGPDPGCAWD